MRLSIFSRKIREILFQNSETFSFNKKVGGKYKNKQICFSSAFLSEMKYGLKNGAKTAINELNRDS